MTARGKRRRKLPSSFSIGTQDFIQKNLTPTNLRDPYYFAVSLSARGFAVFFLLAELTINTVFALLYLAVPGCVSNMRLGYPADAFFFSLETLATIGYGVMAPATTYGHVVSACEIVTGTAFTAIITGLLFLRFSRPKARIVYADHPVVTTHNGKPTLMLRLGNGRSSFMTNAVFSLHALTRQVSIEGQHQRGIQDLRLVRPRLPVFAIFTTLMHVIDEDSPLHRRDARPDIPDDLRLVITMTARDQTTGQNVSDLHAFLGADIKVGMRYVDAIRVLDDNRLVADYASISAMEADGTV